MVALRQDDVQGVDASVSFDGATGGALGLLSDGSGTGVGERTMSIDIRLYGAPTDKTNLSGTEPNDHDPNPFLHRLDLSFVPGQWSSPELQDFDLAPTMDLDGTDLQFLNLYSANVPFEWENSLHQDMAMNGYQRAKEQGNTDTGKRAALCAEAFRRSYWKFLPGPRDNCASEQPNLSLPTSQAGGQLQEPHIGLPSRATRARFSTGSRDKMVALLAKTCRPENLFKAMDSFPSVELLDTLLQYYLTSPVAQADLLFHAATLDPNELRPELLSAMVAAGAVLTADPALTKLGYAIQECLRVAVPMMVRALRPNMPSSR